jgi:hypothetical protein
VEELVELRRVDPSDRLLARDQALFDHVHRRPESRGGGSLRAARLEEVQLAVLDGELDVLHVPVVLLQALHRLDELRERTRLALLHRLERLRRSDTRDDVLTLRVGEELAVEAPLAGGGVAREADAGAGVVALVPEDHLDDVHGRPEVVRDRVGAAVHLRAWRLPRVEDRPHGPAQLLARVRRELAAGRLAVDPLVRPDQLAEVVGIQVDVLAHAAGALEVGQRLLEPVRVDPVHDLAVHLDQAPVRVVGEARVARAPREPLHGLVVQPQVQDRVHHPGHRDGGARAHGDEQRVAGVAEALAGPALERREMLFDLLLETVGQVAAASHVRAARVRRDCEAGRDRHAERGHLREPHALPAEELLPAFRGLVEVVDQPRRHRHARGSSHRRRRLRPSCAAHDAGTSAFRCSTIRITRCAVSSIDSSEMSITGHPSRRCSTAACSSSS